MPIIAGKGMITVRNLPLILWCLVFTLTTLIFSYQATLFFFPLTELQQNTIHFLQGKEELQINYTPEELSHLKDVASLMKWLYYTFYITFVLSLAFPVYYFRDKQKIALLFKAGGISVLIMVVFIFLFSLINFDALFVFFHQLFFPQGNWQFSADSLLITVFPESFFITFSKFMFLPALVVGVFFIISSIILDRKENKWKITL